jgi:hypothetical protein
MSTALLTLKCTLPNLHIAQSMNPKLPTAFQSKCTRGREDCEGHILLLQSEPMEGGGND